MLDAMLGCLTEHHYKSCAPYKRVLDALAFDAFQAGSYYDIPFLPVRLFKEHELLSVEKENVIKTMTSSGTTEQAVSKIFLDKETAANQQKVLVKIVSSVIGQKRVPLLILDSSSVLKDRNMFSARGAGILGFSIFSSETKFAFDENMQLDREGVSAFIDKYKGRDLLVFGFTYIIWQHFYMELMRSGYKPDLSRGILFHGGGWKKMLSEAVSPAEYKSRLFDVCGISRIHNYYGMVEQTGCIYIECEQGHLHASIFSDVIMRRSLDFSVCEAGEKGIIEVVSVLSKSYPGHILLTEDEGVVLGEDDCQCGRLGKYFAVTGRLQNAEVRGCSDTYAKIP
jgi:phenylacetate-coenzyme A ligase PaaK-like adenylate-forming protein